MMKHSNGTGLFSQGKWFLLVGLALVVSYGTAQAQKEYTTQNMYFDSEALVPRMKKMWGIKSGEVRTFYPTGQLKEKVVFYKGRLGKGASRRYGPQGALLTEWSCQDNRGNCDVTMYYPNGHYRFKAHYKNYVLNGEYVLYHENEQLKEKGAYLGGAISGDIAKYNEKGTYYLLESRVNGSFLSRINKP